ncbi:MAG: glycosyltransferase [Geobacteraceae bacterium]|nr:glycosyltransferase [Geobacteraceae bacterium]
MANSISLITATFNSATTLRLCLSSVSSQRVVPEHIIIDGASTDETVGIARSFPHVSTIISEPDNGIYDAMNKGIATSSGDIIGILNSDDFYANPDVLASVARIFENKSIDSCYGDLAYVDSVDTGRITRYWKSGPFNYRNFFWGWMPPHPTFFVRRSVYEKHGMFKLNFGSASDYELMLRLLVKHRITSTYIPETMVRMRAGGVSNFSIINRLKANRMDRSAWQENGLRPYPWTTYLKPVSKISQFIMKG